MSVINLPVALAYGVAAAIIPVVSAASARGDETAAREKTAQAIELTLFLALPSALFCYRFAGDVVALLYGGMSVSDRGAMSGLLQVSALSVLFLSLTQTLASVLVGRGKPYVPVISLAAGVAVKIAFSFFLLSSPSYSIYGAAISMNLCYLVAGTADLVYIIKDGRDAGRLAGYSVKLITISVLSVYGAALIPLAGTVGLFIRLAAGASLFLLLSLPAGLFGGRSVWALAGGKKAEKL